MIAPHHMPCLAQLNTELTAFQRRYTSSIRRCDELERILRFFESEMAAVGIVVTRYDMRDFNSWRGRQLDTVARQHTQMTLLDAWEVRGGCWLLLGWKRATTLCCARSGCAVRCDAQLWRTHVVVLPWVYPWRQADLKRLENELTELKSAKAGLLQQYVRLVEREKLLSKAHELMSTGTSW